MKGRKGERTAARPDAATPVALAQGLGNVSRKLTSASPESDAGRATVHDAGRGVESELMAKRERSSGEHAAREHGSERRAHEPELQFNLGVRTAPTKTRRTQQPRKLAELVAIRRCAKDQERGEKATGILARRNSFS